MKIGELSTATGTPVETVRFYERVGLLPAPKRTSGNFRIYDETHAERLAFVRHCRSLDMTLDEVRVLLQFRDAPERGCGEVNEMVDAHIAHVATRIQELRALEKQLKELRRTCGDARAGGECGILSGLSSAAATPSKPSKSHVRGMHGEKPRMQPPGRATG